MPDTQRTEAELLVLFADNTSGDISPQDCRDLIVSTLNKDFTDLTAATVAAGDLVAVADVDDDNDLKKVTASSVANLADHDSLTNFVANEHINHSSVSVTAGAGLSGGGDITTTRTINVDIANATSATVASSDEILIADVDNGDAIRKVTAQSIADLAGGGGAFTADGSFSAVQGYGSDAGAGSNIGSLAQGSVATASGNIGSFAQGSRVQATGNYGSFAQGMYARAYGDVGSFAQGFYATATGTGGIFCQGSYNMLASGNSGVFSQGRSSTAYGNSGCFAQGDTSVAYGASGCFAQGNGASAFGNYGTFAQGNGVTASTNSAWAVGAYAVANKIGQFSRATGSFASPGDAQLSILVARNQTTNATPANLFLDGSSSRITIPSGKYWAFTMLIAAKQTSGTGTGAGAAYELKGGIKNNSGTTSLVGSVTKTVLGEDTAAWDVAVTADNTNDALDIAVTGEASKTIRWVATIYLSEVG